jgi:hypothetical protein
VSFPSNEELNSKITKSSNYIKWKDLPENTWYKIVSKKEIRNTQILHLSDNIGITYDAFSTSMIKKELINKTGDLYIRSTGKSQNKKYYGFDIHVVQNLLKKCLYK